MSTDQNYIMLEDLKEKEKYIIFKQTANRREWFFYQMFNLNLSNLIVLMLLIYISFDVKSKSSDMENKFTTMNILITESDDRIKSSGSQLSKSNDIITTLQSQIETLTALLKSASEVINKSVLINMTDINNGILTEQVKINSELTQSIGNIRFSVNTCHVNEVVCDGSIINCNCTLNGMNSPNITNFIRVGSAMSRGGEKYGSIISNNRTLIENIYKTHGHTTSKVLVSSGSGLVPMGSSTSYTLISDQITQDLSHSHILPNQSVLLDPEHTNLICCYKISIYS